MFIDDAIPEKSIDEDGEAPSFKKNDGEGSSSQSDDVGRQSPEKETTPTTSRRETRSTHGSSSPLILLEVQPPISHDEKPSTSKKPSSRVTLNHPKSNIIDDLDEGLRLRRGPSYSVNHVTYYCYFAQFKPKKVKEALKEENWVEFMHQELYQFVRNDVWELVPRPKDSHVIGTK